MNKFAKLLCSMVGVKWRADCAAIIRSYLSCYVGQYEYHKKVNMSIIRRTYRGSLAIKEPLSADYYLL